MSEASIPFRPVIGLRLNPGILGVIQSGENLPVESSGADGVFADRFDTNLFWWLPEMQLAPAPDPAFRFAASVEGVSDSSGLPLYSAQVTFGLVAAQPAGMAAATAAHPSATFRMIPATSLDVTLTVVGKTDEGADDPRAYPAVLTATSDTTYTATVTLVGPAVTVAYVSLTTDASAGVTVTYAYSVWRQWQPWRVVPVGPIVTGPVIGLPTVVTAGDTEAARMPIVGVIHGGPILSPPPPPPPTDGGNGGDPPPAPTWVTAVDQATATIALSATYAAPAYRSDYTVATGAGASVRPIIDASDLTGFATAHSEFVELTSLGDPSSRYPSIRRLYLGLASGRVVVVPASYLVQRGSAGLGATLQAALDDSPGPHVSGARFEFTFTLAPGVDPIDLARLAQDLGSIPEAAGRTLTPVVPDGLDPRNASAFTGFSACTSEIADGSDAATLSLRATILDIEETPALDLVNLFLHQLTSTVSPMTGTVAVRLDDLYPTPVTTALALQLASTAAGDELALSAVDATTVQIQNVSPLPLHVVGAATISSAGPQSLDVDESLAADAATSLTVPDSTLPLAVTAELDLGTPTRPSDALAFLTVQVETTQSIQHVLSFNATDAFPAPVTQLDLEMSLTAAPDVQIPGVTLSTDHRLDSVTFTVPIVTALTDLSCAVAMTVTDGGPPRHAMLTHDFATEPILIIQSADVEAAQPTT